jgi:hypothetical protein
VVASEEDLGMVVGSERELASAEVEAAVLVLVLVWVLVLG